MSDEQSSASNAKDPADAKADLWALIIVFTAMVGMAVHFISGFTFDF